MNQAAIFLPVAALALLTLSVLLLVPIRRFRASFARQVTAEDFKYGESARVPPEVSIPNRNLMNLLELPVLFYVACIILYLTQGVDALALDLAWAYVALRTVHSAIHLSYNKVEHRLTVYALSNAVLTLIWLRLLLALTRIAGVA